MAKIINLDIYLSNGNLGEQGPTQVKCRLLISSTFYSMNFRHILELLEFDLFHFWKILEIDHIKNDTN